MGTLLAHPRMEPRLVARIEASVSGRRRGGRRSRLVALLRPLGLLAVVVTVGWVLGSVRQANRQSYHRRDALYQKWKASATLTPAEQAFVPRVEQLLLQFSGTYPGDLATEEVQGKGALGRVLGRASVYLRASTTGLRTHAAVAKSAFESGKDGVALCLVDPPSARTEKEMLPKARMVLGGGAPVAALLGGLHRLHEAEVGLPFSSPSWGERITKTEGEPELLRLEREVERAPMAAAKTAMAAEILLAVLDEPNEPGGATELDGEHAHSIRVIVYSLKDDATLLRSRKRVDPSWITPNRRSQYARELDGCSLALDILSELTPN
jgi:hypothetical protein